MIAFFSSLAILVQTLLQTTFILDASCRFFDQCLTILYKKGNLFKICDLRQRSGRKARKTSCYIPAGVQPGHVDDEHPGDQQGWLPPHPGRVFWWTSCLASHHAHIHAARHFLQVRIWRMILMFNLPFLRFHSTVCLFEIWKKSFKYGKVTSAY